MAKQNKGRSHRPGTFMPARREEFLDRLRKAGALAPACRAMGINLSTPAYWRGRDPSFAADMLKALGRDDRGRVLARVACAEGVRPALVARRHDATPDEKFDIFFAELAMTSCVVEAARKAGISRTVAYHRKRTDPVFARRWIEALDEGYAELEMEMLARARFGVERPIIHNGKEVGRLRTFNDAIALRLLSAHKEAVMRYRAEESGVDEDALLDEIDAKLAAMKRRLEAGEPPGGT